MRPPLSSKSPFRWLLRSRTLLLGLLFTGQVCAIPYSAFHIRVDGDQGEWREPTFRQAIHEQEAPAGLRNRLEVRLAWTVDALLIAGDVVDSDMVTAPPDLQIEQFHQYDSVQIYIDPNNDSIKRMNGDDVNLLLLPDGRSGVLRGDDLVANLAKALVPQRRAAPLAHSYAARRNRDGWSFEVSVPFAGLGLTEPAGKTMKLDVAMNDWVEQHAPAHETAFSEDNLRQGGSPRDALPADEVGSQLWPLTWRNNRDFGFPAHWWVLRLDGQIPLSERFYRALGGTRLMLLAALLCALGAVAAALITEWHARRRIRRLLGRMPGRHPIAVEPVPTEPLGLQRPDEPKEASTVELAVAEVSAPPVMADTHVAPTTRDREFAEQVLAHVRANLDTDLSPALLAAAMHTSLRSLQRRLRDGMDTSPQDLVLAARLEAAHALLRQGGLRVSEVAFRVGFEDLSHFSKRFRAAYGAAPSQVNRNVG